MAQRGGDTGGKCARWLTARGDCKPRYNNNKWQYRSTVRINTLNHNDLFPIAKLYSFNFLIFIVQYYNKGKYDLAYEKAGLIEILNIIFYNIIFNNYILKKSKSNFNYL